MQIKLLFILPAILLVSSSLLRGQTVTTSALSRTGFCEGETITVDYTVTGTFQSGNAFILQLSDPTGGFQSGFRNIGSISSTTSGSITTQLPDGAVGTAYRVRVIASNPRVDGSDNGSNLSIERSPKPSINSVGGDVFWGMGLVTFVGGSVTINDTAGTNYSSIAWNFGSDATPGSSTQSGPIQVSWSTPGIKTITYTVATANGCQSTASRAIEVLERNPVIPADVKIVQGEDTIDNRAPGVAPTHYWICPGGTLRGIAERKVVVFVEAGGNYSAKYSLSNSVIYVRSGGTVSLGSEGATFVIYEDGAGINLNPPAFATTIEVTPLTFDYTNVPAGGCPSLAPYTVQIKPDTNSIHDAQQDNRSDTEYWIRNGGDLSSTGNNNIHYVEAGGTLKINGDNNRIYVKEDGSLNVQSGTGNRIIYEVGAKVINTGVEAVLLPSSGITFDLMSGVAVAGENQVQVSLRPNPTSGAVEVSSGTSGDEIRSIQVIDMLGRVYYETEVGRSRLELDLGDLPSGVYNVAIQTERGMTVQKLVRE